MRDKIDSEALKCAADADVRLNQMFRPYALKMEAAGLHPIVINMFKCYYGQLVYGAQGKVTEQEILPVQKGDIPDYQDIESYEDKGAEALRQTVVIKLNGGLGTGMGLDSPKSLIPVRGTRTFLELMLSQIRFLRNKYKVELPFLLMNSFKTHMETMLALRDFDNGLTYIEPAFLQHRYPKILQDSLAPVSWPANPEQEWNPPGHGDIYTALLTSNLLQNLLEKGYNYAFVSNADNLGAIMDRRILGYMYANELPFLMEVADRTKADRKGGHLMRLRSKNRLALREVAQCPENEIHFFSDIERYCFFQTNSIWLDLRVLEQVFLYHRSIPLDLIINPKNVDSRDAASPRIFQLETAMGSAISAFRDAVAIRVPRNRFAPVKSTADLLLVRSDCYVLTEQQTLVVSPQRLDVLPVICLDDRYYRNLDDFNLRFPDGPPSLLECTSLIVTGDIVFEPGVVLRGDVRLENHSGSQVKLLAGQVVTGKMIW